MKQTTPTPTAAALSAQAAQVAANKADAARRLQALAVAALDGREYDHLVASAALVEEHMFDLQAIELARRLDQARQAERQAAQQARQARIEELEAQIRKAGAERDELTRRMRATYPEGEPRDPAGIVRFATDRAKVLELSQTIEQLQQQQAAIAFEMGGKEK